MSSKNPVRLRTGAEPDPCPVYPRPRARKGGESGSSRKYANGKAVRYRYRMRGPRFPVKMIRPGEAKARGF